MGIYLKVGVHSHARQDTLPTLLQDNASLVTLRPAEHVSTRRMNVHRVLQIRLFQCIL